MLLFWKKTMCYDKSSLSKEWYITQQKLLYLLLKLYVDNCGFYDYHIVVFCVIPLYWWLTGQRMKTFVIPSVIHQLQLLKLKEDHQLVYKAIEDAAVLSPSPNRQVIVVTKCIGFLHVINNVQPWALDITVFLRMSFSWTAPSSAFASDKGKKGYFLEISV